MNDRIETERASAQAAGVTFGRRQLLKLTGASVAAFGLTSVVSIPFAKAQDMSNGANNLYTSDRVALENVRFKSQYQMNVAGNLFVPKDPARGATSSATRWAR